MRRALIQETCGALATGSAILACGFSASLRFGGRMNCSFGRIQMMLRGAAAALAVCGVLACNDSIDPIAIDVAVTPVSTDLLTGDSTKLTATVSGATGNDAVQWTSSASAIASVSNAGIVLGVAPGSATISATSVADPTKVATVAVRVSQKYVPITGTYDLTFTFDSTRLEATAPNNGCPTSQGYCTYTRPTGVKSTLSASMKILDSTFNFTPTFPSGPTRVVSIAEVMMSGRFCKIPDFAIPVGCVEFEDMALSRHTALITRVTAMPATSSFVRIDSGTVSGDFPTERFLSLTYDVAPDSLYGRFLWIMHKSVRSPIAQMGSFVAKRRK